MTASRHIELVPTPGPDAGRGTCRRDLTLVATVLVAAGVVAAMAASAVTTDPPVPGITPVSPAVTFGLPVVRVLADLSAVLAVGLSLVPALLRTPDGGGDLPGRSAAERGARAGALVAAAVWSGSAIAALWLQAAEIDPAAPLSVGAVADLVLQFDSGRGLLATAGAALGCAVLAAYGLGRALPPEPQLGLALLGLLPGPAFGHASTAASSQAHTAMLLSTEVHVLAASAWVGGLAALVAVAVPRRHLLATGLPRFSRLAALCLLGVAVSGVVNAGLELGPDAWARPAALLASDYGVLVLNKVAVTAAIGVIGALMRRRLVRQALDGRTGAFTAWATAELVLMGLAFGLAAVLSHSSAAG